jgi:hypothetical protein
MAPPGQHVRSRTPTNTTPLTHSSTPNNPKRRCIRPNTPETTPALVVTEPEAETDSDNGLPVALSLHRQLTLDSRLPASTPTDPASGRIAGAPEVEPSAPVSISIGTRVLNDIGDQQLLEYKQDSCSRPSWKTIGQRLRRTPESCQARWMFLQNTRRT